MRHIRDQTKFLFFSIVLFSRFFLLGLDFGCEYKGSDAKPEAVAIDLRGCGRGKHRHRCCSGHCGLLSGALAGELPVRSKFLHVLELAIAVMVFHPDGFYWVHQAAHWFSEQNVRDIHWWLHYFTLIPFGIRIELGVPLLLALYLICGCALAIADRKGSGLTSPELVFPTICVLWVIVFRDQWAYSFAAIPLTAKAMACSRPASFFRSHIRLPIRVCAASSVGLFVFWWGEPLRATWPGWPIDQAIHFIEEAELQGVFLCPAEWRDRIAAALPEKDTVVPASLLPSTQIQYVQKTLHLTFIEAEEEPPSNIPSGVSGDILVFQSGKSGLPAGWRRVYGNNVASVAVNVSSGRNLDKVDSFFRRHGISYDREHGFSTPEIARGSPAWYLNQQESFSPASLESWIPPFFTTYNAEFYVTHGLPGYAMKLVMDAWGTDKMDDQGEVIFGNLLVMSGHFKEARQFLDYLDDKRPHSEDIGEIRLMLEMKERRSASKSRR